MLLPYLNEGIKITLQRTCNAAGP